MIPTYVSYIFEELKLEKIISAKLCEKFNDDKQFEEIIKIMLKNLKGSRDEDFFRGLIFASIELQNIENPQISNYEVPSEKNVDESRIDNCFLATLRNDDKTDLIHEYKVLTERTLNNDSIDKYLNDALWQVFCKNYISGPLAKRKNEPPPSFMLKG